MKIVVTADGAGLDAHISAVFGRCRAYVFVDTDSMAFDAIENPAIGAPSGAGIQAAQLVADYGAKAAITGNVGPNAFNVFQSVSVPIYLFSGGTVREAVEAFKADALISAGEANAQVGIGSERACHWEAVWATAGVAGVRWGAGWAVGGVWAAGGDGVWAQEWARAGGRRCPPGRQCHPSLRPTLRANRRSLL